MTVSEGQRTKKWAWSTKMSGYCTLCGQPLTYNTIIWQSSAWHPFCAFNISHKRVIVKDPVTGGWTVYARGKEPLDHRLNPW